MDERASLPGQHRRSAEAVWRGPPVSGYGTVQRDADAEPETMLWEGRIGLTGEGTTPEQLMAAAHAGCLSMMLAEVFTEAGGDPEEMRVSAECSVAIGGDGLRIARMDLTVHARVPGLDEPGLRTAVKRAEAECPVSNALRGTVAIRVHAHLVGA